MPSRRPPLTEEQRVEKNAKLRARRAAETADARERRLQENRERKAALKIRRLNNDKTLETHAAQAARKRIARQQETSEQKEARRKQDRLRRRILCTKKKQEEQEIVTASTISSFQINCELKSGWKRDQNTSETTMEVGQSSDAKSVPTVLLLILPTPVESEVKQIKQEHACKDVAPVQPTLPVPSTQLLRLLHQHNENGVQANLSDLELSDPDALVKSTGSIGNERKGIASYVSNQQKKKGIPCSSSVTNSAVLQTIKNLHQAPAKQPHILPMQSNSTLSLESQTKIVTLSLPPATPKSESLPNVTVKTKSHTLSSSSRAIKPKTPKPRLILPKQSKSTPGVLLTWSFNQINQIPLAISAVIPPSCQKRTTLPMIVYDSQSKKATLSQSSVTPESVSLPMEWPVTKSHTITLTNEAEEPKVATSIPMKTIVVKSLLNSPQAAGKEISDSLRPAEVLQTCSRQQESSISKNNRKVLPAQDPGTILKSLRQFRPLRLPGSALVKDATATHPALTAARAKISSSVQF